MNEGRAAVATCCPPRSEPDLRPVEGELADDELAALAKALAHPARIKILRLLALKDAGLIHGEVDGPRVCYCLEPRAVRRLKALVGGL
jgi:hypothetical protein